VYKRDYAFRMNVMEEIFEIRSCTEILVNDIEADATDQYICSTVNKESQGIHTSIGDLKYVKYV